jgi:hypothetical protein
VIETLHDPWMGQLYLLASHWIQLIPELQVVPEQEIQEPLEHSFSLSQNANASGAIRRKMTKADREATTHALFIHFSFFGCPFDCWVCAGECLRKNRMTQFHL